MSETGHRGLVLSCADCKSVSPTHPGPELNLRCCRGPDQTSEARPPPHRHPSGRPSPTGDPSHQHYQQRSPLTRAWGQARRLSPRTRPGGELRPCQDVTGPRRTAPHAPAPGSEGHAWAPLFPRREPRPHRGHPGEERIQSSELRSRQGGSSSQRPSYPAGLPPGIRQGTAWAQLPLASTTQLPGS